MSEADLGPERWALPSRVLVPLDGSKLAAQAMPTARALAQRFGAQLHTITVAKTDDEVDGLRTAVAALGSTGDEPVSVVVADDVAQGIVGHAAELDPCVICLTTHGRGRVRGAILGSVARSVLQQCPHPMVALGPLADNPGTSPRPMLWPEPLSVNRIVACVDGQPMSEQSLPVAAAWARSLGMSLTILTIIEDTPTPTRDHDRYRDSGDADAYIAQLVDRWSSHAPDVDGEVFREPIGLASGIRAYLDERPAGLVAITTRGRSGFERLRFGASAATIVHASVAPCLVVPAPATSET